MKFYLSSYKIGNEVEQLKKFFSQNKSVCYIPNALDFSGVNPNKRQEHIESDMASLREIGLDVQLLDLRKFFGQTDILRKQLDALGGLWISGGNVFVLRQAMKLSGLDSILHELNERKDFVYGGYSAAGCVLSKRLDAYKIVDDATDTPYPEMKEVIWEGIGLLDYAFLPHFDSDHPESADIAKEIRYCTDNHIPFKTLRDGEVLIQ